MEIPKLWKTAEIIPVPKRSKIESMNDLRPVALTPAIMKVFERFVLKLLLNEVKEQLVLFNLHTRQKEMLRTRAYFSLTTY